MTNLDIAPSGRRRRARTEEKKKQNPYRYITPYEYKEYPKKITLGEGDDAQRVRVHSYTEEQRVLAGGSAGIMPGDRDEPQPAAVASLPERAAPPPAKAAAAPAVKGKKAAEAAARANLLRIARDELKIPGVKDTWSIDQLRTAVEGHQNEGAEA